WGAVMRREHAVVDRVVARAAAVKAAVVSQDEREAGLRAILNFGHTFAHAIEKVSGYGVYTHGEAVATGMRAALHLSRALNPTLSFDRADALVARIPVPPGIADLDVEKLTYAMRSDKKVRAGKIRFVVLDRIGHAYATDDVTKAAIRDAWLYSATPLSYSTE
ncbi:MAG: 3-dehydroquinate synthase, partial [Rhodothermales bacterium]